MILLDANILLRLTNETDPEYRRTQRVLFTYRKTDLLVIAPQSLFEFWAVATRPLASNGMGLPIDSAKQWIATCQRMFPLLTEPSDIVPRWAALVEQFHITGFRAHDVRYVAMMQVHGINQFMTYNVKHFDVFPITIVDPMMS